MKKRIFSILMVVTLLLAMIPAIPAAAAITWPAVSSTVTIGGKNYIYQGNTAGGHFFDSNIVASAYRVGTDGYILWDGEDTLTLHNANLTTMSSRGEIGYGIGIDYGTVVLEGQNKINITVSDSNLFTYHYAVGLLYEGYRESPSDRNVLMGSGSLEIDVKHTGNQADYGEYYTYGLYSFDDLAVTDCDLNIEMNSYLAQSAYAIYVDEGMNVTGAKITADVRADAYACCINVDRNLYATDSTLLGTSDGSYNGDFDIDYLDFINAYGDMTLIDCIVRGETCEGDGAESAYGLYCDNNMAIKNTAIILDFPYDYGDQYKHYAVNAENIYIEKSFVQASEGSLIAYGLTGINGVLNLVGEYITRPTGTKLFTNDYDETGLVYANSNEWVDGFMMTSANYSDVPAAPWYAPAAGFTNATGLFTGTGNNRFSTNDLTTRATLMVVLGRVAGADVNGGTPWYQKGLNWAMANGVSDGTNPNGNITREQIASMLYRLEGSPEVDMTVLDAFSDKNKISNWAKDDVAWAVENGILSGKGNGIMDPLANATRAEVAQIIMNYVTMK